MEPVDLSFIDEVNAVIGTVVVIADYIFGAHWMLFLAFIFLNIVDWITGIMKAKVSKTESSSAGLKGVIKKFGYWLMIVVAFLMAPIFNELGTIIGADVSPFSPLIGYMVLAMMIANEFRSVLENLYQCGVDVPVVILKGLEIFENVANEKQQKIFDGDLEIHSIETAEENYQVKLGLSGRELEQKDSVTLRIQTVDDDED